MSICNKAAILVNDSQLSKDRFKLSVSGRDELVVEGTFSDVEAQYLRYAIQTNYTDNAFYKARHPENGGLLLFMQQDGRGVFGEKGYIFIEVTMGHREEYVEPAREWVKFLNDNYDKVAPTLDNW